MIVVGIDTLSKKLSCECRIFLSEILKDFCGFPEAFERFPKSFEIPKYFLDFTRFFQD